jgi:D-alanine-D-alanine ligase
MTATSLLPQEAAAMGYSFEQLLERLISLGLKRHSNCGHG